eukprot:3559834-Pyramimonas_sp.AAC.1
MADWFRSMVLTNIATKLTAAANKPNQDEAVNDLTDDVFKTIDIIHPAFIAHADDCYDSVLHVSNILASSR